LERYGIFYAIEDCFPILIMGKLGQEDFADGITTTKGSGTGCTNIDTGMELGERLLTAATCSEFGLGRKHGVIVELHSVKQSLCGMGLVGDNGTSRMGLGNAVREHIGQDYTG
jgi:hypothetical protein